MCSTTYLDCSFSTPLLMAADEGHHSTVQMLLAAGADVNHCSADHETALFRASRWGRVRVATTLLAARADPDVVSVDGWTALSYATYHKHSNNLVPVLLDANADVNRGSDDKTPLRVAIQQGNLAMARLLLDKGADWLLKDDGTSARQLSRFLLPSLFYCAVCGWDGMCCVACREKFCRKECDKFSDPRAPIRSLKLDCRLHRLVAHQAVLEWTLTMTSLDLPPYVLEIVFNSLKLHEQADDYQQN